MPSLVRLWRAAVLCCTVLIALACAFRAGGAAADGAPVDPPAPQRVDSAVVAVLACDHPDWEVLGAIAADIDGDGREEAVLLVEKAGSFGTSKPFWVEDDPGVRSSHVFVYRYEDARAVPVWMSSSLGVEVTGLSVDETGALRLTDASGRITVWRWSGWGFELLGETPAREGGASQDDGSTGLGGLSGAAAPLGERAAPTMGSGSDAPMETADQTATLLVAGDNIAHASLLSHAYDPKSRSYVFGGIYDGVRDLVSQADLAVVTQETVLVGDPALASGYPEFATPVSMGDALADAGFDAVLCATNHVADRGAGAIDEMLAYWGAAHPDVAVLGVHAAEADASAPDILDCGGVALACFDYTFGLNGHVLPEERQWQVDVLEGRGGGVRGADRLLDSISRAAGDPAVDLVACFLHMGEEYSPCPSRDQVDLVEQAVDAGADLVVCSHSHVLGPYGRIVTPVGNEAVVFYGLGNLVAHQYDPATVVGGFASISVGHGPSGAEICSFELVPTVCHVSKQGDTRVYLLDDYTDDLACAHYLSTDDHPLTVDSLLAYVPDGL